MEKACETPILFLVFNRPKETQQVLERLRAVAPANIYIAADGPRDSHQADQTQCRAVRDVIEQTIDWPCRINKRYNKQNLGVVKGVTSAIDWFFEQEEAGIILEDDCLPNLSFFPYCTQLLNHYKDDREVMHISGSNFIDAHLFTDASLYFSRFGSCWGWATWRRAWKRYDLNLIERLSEADYLQCLNKVSSNDYYYQYFKQLFDYHRSGEDNIWDWRWTFCIWYYDGLVVNPAANLIRNIGYGQDATTSKGNDAVRNQLSDLDDHELSQLQYPQQKTIDDNIEYAIQSIYHPPPNLSQQIGYFAKRLLPNGLKRQLSKAKSRFAKT